MNENIDLTQILKDCPKGWKFYSTILGEVEIEVCGNRYYPDGSYPIRVFLPTHEQGWVTKEGKHYIQFDGECTLFPSKDQRDWSKFTAPWYKKGEV